MGLDTFFAAVWEIFKGPLLFLAAPAIPVFLICLAVIGSMTVRELRKK